MMFALPISMPRFKSNNFHQNSPKIKLFLQNKQSFQALKAPPPNLLNNPPPPMQISGWLHAYYQL